MRPQIKSVHKVDLRLVIALGFAFSVMGCGPSMRFAKPFNSKVWQIRNSVDALGLSIEERVNCIPQLTGVLERFDYEKQIYSSVEGENGYLFTCYFKLRVASEADFRLFSSRLDSILTDYGKELSWEDDGVRDGGEFSIEVSGSGELKAPFVNNSVAYANYRVYAISNIVGLRCEEQIKDYLSAGEIINCLDYQGSAISLKNGGFEFECRLKLELASSKSKERFSEALDTVLKGSERVMNGLEWRYVQDAVNPRCYLVIIKGGDKYGPGFW